MPSMVRTQIYMTATEKKELYTIAKATGEKQSVLIREALDAFIENFKESRKANALKAAYGIWKNHENLEDLSKIRQELDRKF